MNQQVGIAEMKISSHPDDVLITYSLGSCVGLSVYDPQAGIGGMVHTMLPLSSADPVKAQSRPCMFTDSGIELMLNELFGRGARKNNLVIKVAGGATMLDQQEIFRIGERNVAIVRKLMWKNGILIKAIEVGGTISRTMSLEIATGITRIRSNGQAHEL